MKIIVFGGVASEVSITSPFKNIKAYETIFSLTGCGCPESKYSKKPKKAKFSSGDAQTKGKTHSLKLVLRFFIFIQVVTSFVVTCAFPFSLPLKKVSPCHHFLFLFFFKFSPNIKFEFVFEFDSSLN